MARHTHRGICKTHGAVMKYNRTGKCATCVGVLSAARRYGHAHMMVAQPTVQGADLHSLITQLEREAALGRKVLDFFKAQNV